MKTKMCRNKQLGLFLLVLGLASCKTPLLSNREVRTALPETYSLSKDTTNMANLSWKKFFRDSLLGSLIDTALQHNQELALSQLEIDIRQFETLATRGEYQPFLQWKAAAGADHSGKYTFNGMSEEDVKNSPDKGPRYIGDFPLIANFSWELDIWKKLRNTNKAAWLRYMASQEGRNFLITQTVAEIASSYYELVALDNLLQMLEQNAELQKNALDVVKLEKNAARVTQLAVNRFEAQLLYTRNLQFDIRQKIVEAENRIHFLTGKMEGPIRRISEPEETASDFATAGLPADLLRNRPDLRAAETELAAAKLDVQVARANFYPSLRLSAAAGLQAFNPLYVFRPASLLYGVAADMAGPLINKKGIRAAYQTANAKQMQALYGYEQKILNAYLEVSNQLAALDNYGKSVETKQKEVEILNQSIGISNNLFRSARADYIEVLLTQREALESKIDLIEIRLKKWLALVNLYKSLGGGWKS